MKKIPYGEMKLISKIESMLIWMFFNIKYTKTRTKGFGNISGFCLVLWDALLENDMNSLLKLETSNSTLRKYCKQISKVRHFDM